VIKHALGEPPSVAGCVVDASLVSFAGVALDDGEGVAAAGGPSPFAAGDDDPSDEQPAAPTTTTEATAIQPSARKAITTEERATLVPLS